MNRVVLFFLIAASLFLGVGCSNSERVASSADSDAYFTQDTLDGMIRVQMKNASISLGTNDRYAKSDERPRMQVSLDYSFSIGRHEVTCKEFNSLMHSATKLVLDCDGSNFPATDLTFYDAVLFANERSKAEDLDTAYTYIHAYFDNQKHCTSLEGFAFHPEVNAYRLPTEAEWMLVARSNWDPAFAWTADNSDYKLHKVCSLADSSTIVCDMLGNAMEWVNDWLGYFRDTTVVNYVGAPDGGSFGQRIVKGGSYKNTSESITSYGRGDVYMVTSSTRVDYVGFRLAYGSVPNAVWIAADGNAATTRVVPLVHSTKLRSLAGTYKAKLAFRNELTGNIAYVDYSMVNLTVTEIVDTIDAYHPDISPDGSKVAFCTGLEGISGKSKLYVRNLDVEGSNLVQLDVESAAIPRWRVSRGDTVIVYVTDAGNNADESSFKGASTWQVKFENGKFGKPQKLFDGAYHGGISDDNLLAVSGARVLRARSARPGARTASDINELVWYNGEQACNVSLAKDKSKRTLFLDFGGETGQKFVGKKYRTHERLLVTDNGGDLIQTVAAPKGYTFDHSEWASGDSGLVVATLTNTKGAHQKIALVHLADSSIVELMEGDDLWHPCLWVKPRHFVRDGIKLDLDSAGIYFNEWGGEAAAILRYKMELLWKYWDTANVVIMGSSRPLDGVNPSLLDKKFFALNMAHVPNMMASSDYLMTNYVFPHVTNLKYVVISLDIDMWYRSEKTESNFFYKEYKNYPGYVYDRDHKFWVPRAPDELEYLTEESMGAESYFSNFVETRGFNPADPNTWESKPSVENDSTWMSERSAYYYANMKHLKNILTQAKEKDVYVIGVIFPQSPGYKKTGALGRYGIRRSEAPKLLKELNDLSKEYPNFVFWDENQMGDHDYTDEMASNKDHLSYLGAKQLTLRLNAKLKKLK